jgi:hypothetical protein
MPEQVNDSGTVLLCWCRWCCASSIFYFKSGTVQPSVLLMLLLKPCCLKIPGSVTFFLTTRGACL